jgi:hypothetical protein
MILVGWTRIRIGSPKSDPGEQKLPTKIKRSKEIACFEVQDILFERLKASPVTLTSFKKS